jgi:uncharacterized HAD superfamily protein
MSTYVILDLDNTIADDAWRIPSINWQWSNPTHRYHDYHSLAAFDELGNQDLVWGHGHKLLIFTARPVHYAALTHQWLQRKGVAAEHVIMRNDGDRRSSVQLKATMLDWLHHYDVDLRDVVGAYDDRPDVVEMYKARGIPAEVRSIHNICAYTAPQEAA